MNKATRVQRDAYGWHSDGGKGVGMTHLARPLGQMPGDAGPDAIGIGAASERDANDRRTICGPGIL
jgi:hypothetical protein